MLELGGTFLGLLSGLSQLILNNINMSGFQIKTFSISSNILQSPPSKNKNKTKQKREEEDPETYMSMHVYACAYIYMCVAFVCTYACRYVHVFRCPSVCLQVCCVPAYAWIYPLSCAYVHASVYACRYAWMWCVFVQCVCIFMCMCPRTL